MGKTISFVATDELAEWIEQESERRMTTVSSTAQQLLAEKFREESGGSSSGGESEGVETEREEGDESVSEDESDDSELPAIFDKHSDKWYVPNSKEGYKFAVRMPEGIGNKYYKTVDGAADRLRSEYE